MTRDALLIPVATALLVAGCQRGAAPANNSAAAAPRAAQPESDVSAAERLVRQRLGNPQGLAFAAPQRSASQGVRIICGQYAQGGGNHRYIVVASRDVFVEPGMRAGEMDRAFVEFCAGGGERG